NQPRESRGPPLASRRALNRPAVPPRSAGNGRSIALPLAAVRDADGIRAIAHRPAARSDVRAAARADGARPPAAKLRMARRERLPPLRAARVERESRAASDRRAPRTPGPGRTSASDAMPGSVKPCEDINLNVI